MPTAFSADIMSIVARSVSAIAVGFEAPELREELARPSAWNRELTPRYLSGRPFYACYSGIVPSSAIPAWKDLDESCPSA